MSGAAERGDAGLSPWRPPKPEARPRRISLWQYVRLFRRDILSAQPAHLYRAWMADFRTPFFRSCLVNDPDLVELVLKRRPMDFPKSVRTREGLVPLLGRHSVFLTNGEEWLRQRRIIDPAFAGGRLRETFPAISAAADAGLARLARMADRGEIDIEPETSHITADVIFRTLFSVPIEDEIAAAVFREFRAYQRAQPLLNLAAFIPLPRLLPRFHRRTTRITARRIRALIERMIARRRAELAAGTAADDLATKIMTMADPETGKRFSDAEMRDQVAIFFLAGHETSAAALAWALWLVAKDRAVQARIRAEAEAVFADRAPSFGDISRLSFTRDVFRETLRLYPPVPMMVRETTCPETFRGRELGKGTQIVISPWHLHRHERLWPEPDLFDPARWQRDETQRLARKAWLPFSVGPRVCSGAGMAMIEGVLVLSRIVQHFELAPGAREPVPEAQLTVRSRAGIGLRIRQIRALPGAV